MSSKILEALQETYKNCNIESVFTTESCTEILCNTKPNNKAAAFVLSMMAPTTPVYDTIVKEQHMSRAVGIQDLGDVKADTTPLIFDDTIGYRETPMMTFRKHIDFNEDECLRLKRLQSENPKDEDVSKMLTSTSTNYENLSEGFWNTVAYQAWTALTTGVIKYYTQTPGGYTEVNYYNTGNQISTVPTAWSTLAPCDLEAAINNIIGLQEDTGCCSFTDMAMSRNTFNKLICELKGTTCCNTVMSNTATGGLSTVQFISGLRVHVVPSNFLVPDFANNDVNTLIPVKLLQDGQILFYCDNMRIKMYDMLNVVPETRFDDACDESVTVGGRTQCEKSKLGGRKFSLYYNYGLSFDKSASLLVNTGLL